MNSRFAYVAWFLWIGSLVSGLHNDICGALGSRIVDKSPCGAYLWVIRQKYKNFLWIATHEAGGTSTGEGPPPHSYLKTRRV